MLTVLCYLFPGPRNYMPAYVNVLFNGIARNMTEPFRFVCVTDYPAADFAPGIEVMPVPESAWKLLYLTTPEGPRFPSSYVRLWTFSEEARCLGDRVLLLDIDCAITGPIQPLLEYDDDFVGWCPRSDWGRKKRIAGGTYLLTPGTRTDVFDSFHGEQSIAEARAANCRGSDQAWLTYCLSDTATYWPDNSGIYQAQDYVDHSQQARGMSVTDRRIARRQMQARAEWPLPDDAIICHFNGRHKPWDSNWSWVKEHWR